MNTTVGARPTNELNSLPTEARHAETAHFDKYSATEMVAAMHRGDREALLAVERVLPQVAQVIEAVAARLRRGGRLVYVGAGTSGRLGVLDASECPPTFHTPPEMVQGVIAGGEHALRYAVEGAEDDAASGAAAMREREINAEDVVVGIAASGRTPYVLGAMQAARDGGALTVGVSCAPGSAVEQAGALAITPATGAEVLTGSTRLKAGTATKLVLNMISTGAMARLGYVHGNLMVHGQPTNAKLRDRAVRIVAELCELSRDEAAAALERASDVRTAVVMVKLALEPAAARERLQAAGGVLRQALEGESI